MSDRAGPAATYLVQRAGGTLHPDDASLEQWINDRAVEGWRLIAVDNGMLFFEKAPALVVTRRDAHPQ